MRYISHARSPLGEILLAADDAGVTGLWFIGQKYFARGLSENPVERETPALAEAKRWLTVYFSGQAPAFTPPLHLVGTPFQLAAWELLRAVPYGQTTTYGAIAQAIAQKRGLPHMSAQAVGGAVGRNAVSLIVPCHRVVGRDGSLTGYAGGIDRKLRLLTLERTGDAGDGR